jgi:IS30 family transposase
MSGYTHLTEGQSYQIEALHKVDHNQTMIANVFVVHKSMVSRDLQRNRGHRGYRRKQAHETALQRRNEKPRTHMPLTT